MESEIIRSIKDFINRFKLIDIEKTYILAVSGGPDSIFLMDVLFSIYRGESEKKFIVVYIHHGLRKEADKELAFVKNLADEYGFRFYSGKIKLKKEKGESIEDIARKKRYKTLKEIARKKTCAGIITGHTLDDQTETVFLNLIRGSGLTGICAMPPKIEIEPQTGIFLIRPLLFTLRKNIMEYIKKKHLEFKSDRSNLNFKFRRNYLRHTVLPTIEKINPGFKKSVGRLTCILQADNDFIKNCSEYFYKRITKETDKNKISLDLKKFNRIHTSMQREIIKMIVRRILKSKYSPPFLVIEEVRKKITGNRLPINIRELSISLSLCNGIIIIQKNPAGL